MMILADLATGKSGAAEALFLVATVLFVIVAIVHLVTQPLALTGILLAAGLACVAFAWVLL